MGSMGTFRVHPDQQLELEGLVDTGAIEPAGTRAVHYADGTRDVVPVAKADIAINGVETATVVLCARLIPIEAPMAAARAAV